MIAYLYPLSMPQINPAASVVDPIRRQPRQQNFCGRSQVTVLGRPTAPQRVFEVIDIAAWCCLVRFYHRDGPGIVVTTGESIPQRHIRITNGRRRGILTSRGCPRDQRRHDDGQRIHAHSSQTP
ncbi:hypothetical protein [Nocardia suismassiliense]|uniref:hypothetical protein n=1 Tax=Nocardia suismassiliense TaxID=2077092 RepID=UPI00131F349B|nr:hypothetical protein [Nocardia suismassiliense]